MRGLPKALLTATLTAIAAIWLSVGCTVTPKIIQASAPSFDGSVQNSGVIGYYTNVSGLRYRVLTQRAADRYNGLVDIYGKTYVPPVTRNEGLSAFTNGTWLLDAEHTVRFREMNLRHKAKSVKRK